MMKNSTKFIVVSTWIILTRIYDAYCTYQLTPDLDKESNPLVSILGMSWLPLLIVIGVLTLYTIYAYYQRLFAFVDFFPVEKRLNFSEFVGYTYLGKKAHWTVLFYKFPKDIRRFNLFMGILLSKSLIIAGFISTFMWILIRNTSWYPPLHHPAIIYSLLIFCCLMVNYFWYLKAYKNYQNS
jgi:hypothetical protein